MSITPGFRHDKKFVVMALRRDSDTKGADYIAAGAQPLAILTKGLAVDPYQSEQITRDLDTGEQGGEKVIHAGEMMTLTIPVEIAGSGDASSAAAYSAILQTAMRDEKTDVANEVTHNRVLNASEEQDGTFYFYWEGMYHILLAGKSSLTVAGKINELGYLTFEVKGIYGDTIEGLPPQPDFSGFQDPLPLSNSNTKFTLDAQALNLYEYELADNHNVEHDEGTEQNQVFIESWSEEGKFIIESPALSTFDPFALMRTSTLVPFTFTHGVANGEVFEQSSSGIQILTVKPTAIKGKQAWDCGFRVIKGHHSIIKTS